MTGDGCLLLRWVLGMGRGAREAVYTMRGMRRGMSCLHRFLSRYLLCGSK